MTDKNTIERICRNAGMRPERRVKIKDYDVFIADGFSLPPHNYYRRFGVDANEFPTGMYVTLWWVSKNDDQLDTGQPIFFEAMHDPGMSLSFKKLARINTALHEASGFLKRREKSHALAS